MESSNTLIKTPGNMKFPFYMPNDFFLESKEISTTKKLPEIVCITSYLPRECGIANYSHDLVQALNNQFVDSFSIKICALENENEKHYYEDENVKYILNTSVQKSYIDLATKINSDTTIKIVLLQHEFGFFAESKANFNAFISILNKPLIVAFHTVLPRPDEVFKQNVQHILDHSAGIIVMTHSSSDTLIRDYTIDKRKITVIPHGTHLVPHLNKKILKAKYGLQDRKILSTFGLLSAGKNIETTLDALPNIIKTSPKVLFLIMGKTHPTVALHEGEKYRESLHLKIKELNLENHVKFINKYLPLEELLDYLQLTDIYLFTSKDPNQAVSGTFSYALSCGCPVVSTPIPHAKEVLSDGTGILFDFENSTQLASAVNRLLFDEHLRLEIISKGLHKITNTTWENSAIAHARLIQKITQKQIELHYRNPEINLDHIKKMTTDFGILQFSKFNQPDPNSGYTLDDNARALIALCQHYKYTREDSDLKFIEIYLDFIAYCERVGEEFINYVDYNTRFTEQNAEVNLEDSTGRAIWALGYLISLSEILPDKFILKAEKIFHRALKCAYSTYSPRAMAFIIKGMYCYNRSNNNENIILTTTLLANRLVQMYRHEASEEWMWFESYLTYANSVLPEALLCAYSMTNDIVYKDIAKNSFDFLISKTFTDDAIKVVSNKTWQLKGKSFESFGEQPIDVAYTVITLRKFHDVFKEHNYLTKMEMVFNWFLGNNHLQQAIYNQCTGGCFDGLEENNVNLNQGAESTVSYLMARMMIHKYFGDKKHSFQRCKVKSYKMAAN